MKVKTGTGFEAEINEGIIDNWEYMELLMDYDSGHPAALRSAIKMALGDDGYEALKAHVKGLSDDGKIHTSLLANEFGELAESRKEVKN